MNSKDIAIVFDCGATNVRVIAMDTNGRILASQSKTNATDEDPQWPGGRIWDVDKLWQKLCECAKVVMSSINPIRIAGVSVTTFGVDGAFVDVNGELLYPVISWQCQRTEAVMDNIGKYISLNRLYELSGVYPYAFNTINKFIWMKENRPDVLEKAYRFLFMPSLLINKLTGSLQNDATMLGTSMMTNLKKRKVSAEIMKAIGIDVGILGKIAEPGDKAGEVNNFGNEWSNIPLGTPVFFAGHDTQFAIYGSGAQLNQPVLSSGTWEILMARTRTFCGGEKQLAASLTTEADAISGIYTIGQNWLGSGVLEWFSKHFYSELKGDELFETMIKEAEEFAPGEHALTISPAFYDDGTGKGGGFIGGLTINTQRQAIYRALLESLAFRLREALEAIENAGGFKAESILCVGGGSKNRLWNQLRADICQRKVYLIDQKETTVLGAALFVFAGAKVFPSPEETRSHINYNPIAIEPNTDTAEVWDELYKKRP